MTSDIERRLRALEDEAEIHRMAARFSDAVNARDLAAFAGLWASAGAIWTIGPPLASQAEGREAIVAMLGRLNQIERYFMQMTHSGVVTLAGDRATARFIIREHGRGDGTYYDNLGIYNDELIREADGWRFAKRSYAYRFLNQKPFDDDAFDASK
ncbi:nuclear transport factor 2 family protein [Bradyrhizobium sp. 1(2017)]|uniref:nuclear transport factor 2 family protein n=1 Tax=Bradyrhizobium sp. 1(2017) TaxID=1404888 RepID=UPI00140F4C71|nr:nuclear transport factor 2 family protein [Bradyrhizobium sp. 1(2017)]QIO36900.1 nuclear transport factor 2 family protein [Bradyrhizobium sp. 1(2017)]